MANPYDAFRVNEATRTYTAVRELSADDIIGMAKRLIAARFRRSTTLSDPADAKDFLTLQLAECEREVFACVFLDNRNRVIAFEKLFYGTINGTCVYAREIVKHALIYNAAAVILAHNHPSGHAESSEADRSLTIKLKDALGLIDVRVLDHLIIGAEEVVSFSERKFL